MACARGCNPCTCQGAGSMRQEKKGIEYMMGGQAGKQGYKGMTPMPMAGRPGGDQGAYIIAIYAPQGQMQDYLSALMMGINGMMTQQNPGTVYDPKSLEGKVVNGKMAKPGNVKAGGNYGRMPYLDSPVAMVPATAYGNSGAGYGAKKPSLYN